ncbi:MAG: hypothetical protein M1818_008176 [Claussenomyces sp. TS43310]|nr:MAG: hypothetical protein M1818_008176 [Claussenomyces sp. TS43310]
MYKFIRPWGISQWRRVPVLFAVLVLFLLVVLSLDGLQLHTRFRDYLSECKAHAADATRHDAPPEYNLETYESPFCAERFGRKYLEGLSNTTTGYCTPDSLTNLTCFHSQTSSDSRVDSFCFGRSAVFDDTDGKFNVGCELRRLTPNETSRGTPEFTALSSYWYDTGPRVVFDRVVKMDNNMEAPASTTNYTILIKREGPYNLWHSLMEIWSLTMTLDVLRMTSDSVEDAPFFTLGDVENTQILMLDDEEEGPYFDLWTLFAKRPVVRLNDMSGSTKFENIIVPLAGASNPLWQGDWETHTCEGSNLLRTFTHRVLSFYKIDAWAPHEGDLVLTLIDRKESRRLIDCQSFLEELKAKLPHLKIQIIDFATISFAEQLRIVRETDVLVGVHGAGLTHGMFLREGSVIVEILPDDLNHKGFRNLAGLVGSTYLSTHASKRPESENKRDDWHWGDVFLEKERFMDLMEVAVKVLYNTGSRNYDVN